MAKKSETLKTILFAAVVSLVAGSALLGVDLGLKKRIETNRTVEQYLHILNSLGVELPRNIDQKGIIELYKKSVAKTEVKGITRYEFRKEGKVASYAFNLEGMGLWAPMKAFIALEPDLCTVKQIAIYKQEETPGLGAEIVTKAFRNQFVNKKITDPCDSTRVILHVRKYGTANKQLEVDGISGATMTTTGVEGMLQKGIQDIIRTRGSTSEPVPKKEGGS